MIKIQTQRKGAYTDDNFLKEKLCLHYTQNQNVG